MNQKREIKIATTESKTKPDRFLDSLGEFIREELAQGCRINFGPFAVRLGRRHAGSRLAAFCSAPFRLADGQVLNQPQSVKIVSIRGSSMLTPRQLANKLGAVLPLAKWRTKVRPYFASWRLSFI